MEQKVALIKHPNPNNPMEYCSTVPPLQQVTDSRNQPVPSVLVPVSVLKREGNKLFNIILKLSFLVVKTVNLIQIKFIYYKFIWRINKNEILIFLNKMAKSLR